MIELKPGDVFCSYNPWWTGKAIVAVQKFWDGDAEYGHAGIITNPVAGETLEALGEIEVGNLDRYKGKQVLIARPLTTLRGRKIEAIECVHSIKALKDKQLGRVYPWWRIMLHLFPPLARKVGTGDFLVCSELTAKYLYYIGARGNQYKGVTPDNLADEWLHWRNFEVIFKGEWSADLVTFKKG